MLGAIRPRPSAYPPESAGSQRAESADTAGSLLTPKNLARILLTARRPAEARHQLQTVLAQGPDPEASWLSSRAFLQEGTIAEAWRPSRNWPYADNNPTHPDPAPFVGAASCAECHAEKFRRNKTLAMPERSFRFRRFLAWLSLALHFPTLPSQVTHTLRKIDGRLEQETRTSDRVFKAVVDYAFGSGDRGKTLVGHDDSGRMYELRLSVYHEGKRSLGHHERA